MTLPRLSPEDRALLRSDRDPRSRPTIGQFAVFQFGSNRRSAGRGHIETEL